MDIRNRENRRRSCASGCASCREKGFTLSELLIVVGIIALLVAIAIPNYLEAQQRSLSAACKQNLKTVGMALAMYRVDYDSFPLADGTAGPNPSPGQTSVGNGPAAGGSWDGVPRMLVELGYLKNEKALFCPAMIRRYPDRRENLRYAYNSSALDTFGPDGGADNIEYDRGNLWLVRCLWVPAECSFHTHSGLVYPHGDAHQGGITYPHSLENVLSMSLAVQTRNGRQDFNRSYGLSYK